MTLSNDPAKEIKLGNDVTTVFSFTFVINAAADMVVTHTDALGVETTITEGTGTTNYSISVANYPGNGSITYPATLGTELATGAKLTLARVVDLDQETDLQNQAQYKPETVEATFDYSRMVDLQQQEQIDRSIKVAISDNSGADFTIPAPTADTVIGIWNAAGTAIITGPTASEISGANASAVAAAASAAAASTSETNAGTSETNAAASAVAAAASAASVAFSDVEFVTNADSPITLNSATAGKLYNCDTSSGAIIFNADAISTLTMPHVNGFVKTSSDGNSVTINCDAGDVLSTGGTAIIYSSLNSGGTHAADTDPATDTWTILKHGASAGDMIVDTFVDGTDYTSGTSTTITLSTAPGSENNVQIYMDGVFQQHNTYSVSSITVTFDAAIPSGVGEIEAVIGKTLEINVPANNSVGEPQVDDDVVNQLTAITTLEDTDVFWFGDASDSFNNKKITKANLYAAILGDLVSEGTFTPGFQATGATFGTYTTQLGYYYKVGRLVHVRMRIELGALPTGTLTGSVFINGLPFAQDATVASLFSGHSAGHVFQCNYDANMLGLVIQATTGGTIMEFKEIGDNGGEQPFAASQMNSAFEIRTAFSYLAST